METIWYNAQKGNWDHGLLSSIFDKHPDLFIQSNGNNTKPLRAIIIVTGRPDMIALKTYLEGIDSGIVILASEEEAQFEWKYAITAQFDIWTSYYYASTKSEIKTRLLLGAPNRIKDYKINKHLPKKYLWSFIGQVNNESRQKCVNVLKTLPFGYLKVISGFGGGVAKDILEYQEYLDIMCQSEFVICPSGSMSADCFRVYEAMECGATPIADKRSPRDAEDFNYWESVYPQNNLFIVDEWTSNNLNFLFAAKDHSSNWWNKYKTELEEKLIAYAK